MKRKILMLIFAAVASVTKAPAQSVPEAAMSSDDEIRKILVERIDTTHQSVGIVVGVIEPQGRRVVSYGSFRKTDKRPVDGDTVFEIGSVTKVFTSLLLADMVRRGEVALSDPIANYLPPEVKVPERAGRSITLEDLSTHTSGLPRMPSNLTPKDTANPYADYSVEQLYQFLSNYTLTRDIGSQFEYSNLGGGLLGHVLARRAGMDYETLVRTRILEPLGMNNTRIVLTPQMQAQLAVGHNPAMEPVKNWDFSTLAGAGALRSSANDMLKFLAANLGYAESPLAPAMAAMLKDRRAVAPATPAVTVEVGLAWMITTRGAAQIVWHNGGTGGYRTFVGYDLKRRVGVVALSNAETAAGVDDIGMHLLDARVPLMSPPMSPPKAHTQIAVDPAIFDAYAGRYQLAPSFFITVTRDGDRLFAQATNQPKVEIFPEGQRDYFLKVVEAQISFEVDAEGRTTGLVLHQNGRDSPGKRIE